MTVRVEVYRILGTGDGWSLEIVDHERASTVWGELFDTDHGAYRTFYLTVEEEGLRTFVDAKAQSLH